MGTEDTCLRVTFIVKRVDLTHGGGSHHSFHLTASELARLGHDVRVVSLGGWSLTEDVPYRLEHPPHPLGVGRLPLILDCRALLEEYSSGTDIFHIFDPLLTIAGGLYRGRGGRTPTVVSLYDFGLWCTNHGKMDGECHARCGLVQRVLHSPTGTLRKIRSIPLRGLEQWYFFDQVAHVDHFFANSPSTRRVYQEAGFDMARSTVVPAVIDYAGIRETAADTPSRLPPATSQPWDLLYAGRLVASKGIDVLIEALKSVRVRCHLHVVGDGPDRDPLVARVSQLGLMDRVTFHGWMSNHDLWHFYRTMHVFIHPGRWPEPCGRTVQEAMTLGVPTIVSDIGGPPWLLGPYGRTFRRNDHLDLADQISLCCEDYEQAARAARAGVERAAQFDYRRAVPAIDEVYRQLHGSSETRPSAVSRV